MDGIHDLGGMHGFGPVRPEPDEPTFHADWERRALAVTLATGAHGRWTIDRSRHARESLPPATYLTSSYYEIWLRALERLLVQSGLLPADALCPQAQADLPDGFAATPGESGESVSPPESPAAVAWPALRTALQTGSSYEREVESPPAFAVGAAVRTIEDHPAGHTRLPRYARGKVGHVVAVRGAHVLPDANAVPAGRPAPGDAAWLYTVEFDAPTLWGADADPRSTVAIDAWEPYLRPVEGPR